jgi:hypothetical protein
MSHNTIDDMDFATDGEHHAIDMAINLDVRCTKCDNRYPIEEGSWDEDGYHIKIKPHICVWIDDELEEKIDKIKEELLK